MSVNRTILMSSNFDILAPIIQIRDSVNFIDNMRTIIQVKMHRDLFIDPIKPVRRKDF